MSLYSTAGVGAPWQATSYTHVNDNEGYVLWTRSDIGKANLWQIDPSLPTGPSQLKRVVTLYSTSGVGAPWQADQLHPRERHRRLRALDAQRHRQGHLWQIDPSLPTGPISSSVP